MFRWHVAFCRRVARFPSLVPFLASLAMGSAGRAAFDAELQLDLSGGQFNGSSYVQINHAPGRPNDLFIARQDGQIMRLDLTTKQQSTFFQLPAADISTGQYWGLLGFTFAPDFATSGNLYVHVADDRNVDGHHHRIYIRKYTLSDPLSNSPTAGPAINILRWGQPLADHSGGWIGFQPGDPNTLWITSGDGGNSDSNRDTLRTGQNPTDLLSGILRIDVSGTGAGEFGNYAIPANNPRATGAEQYANWAPELWSIGIRSPWGASFDRATGDFTFGDVGAFKDTSVPIFTSGNEEINFDRAGGDGGRNYGWRVMEGTFFAPPAGQEPSDLPPNHPSFTPPLYEYLYGGGYGSGGAPAFQGRSVTGGHVYRGPVNELQGKYLFADWSSHQVWMLEIDRDANDGRGGVVPGSLVDLSTLFNRLTGSGTPATEGVTAFGEDAAGNLYYVELGGELYKIVGDVTGDFDGNGRVDAADLAAWRTGIELGTSVGDADGDGDSDGADLLLWQQNLGAGQPQGTRVATVPEPSSIGMLAAVWAAVLARIPRRRCPDLAPVIRAASPQVAATRSALPGILQ
jgi:glucose/arabinose dehydrogenase